MYYIYILYAEESGKRVRFIGVRTNASASGRRVSSVSLGASQHFFLL